jgi:hypothetical protein
MTNVKARRNVEVRKCAVQFDDASPLFASSFVYSFVIRHSDFVIRLPRRSAAKAGASSFFLPRGLDDPRRLDYSYEMNPLTNEWAIKHRSDTCTATHRPFAAGEVFYTLLFRDGDGFRREDLSEEAWAARNENIQPFSFWKTHYEPAPPAPPEPLAKETAEQLFRRLVSSNDSPANACYVLAVMLERKRVLKQIKSEQADNGRVLVYEHGHSGDVFIVRDPQLRLDEMESVQNEVAQLLRAAASS